MASKKVRSLIPARYSTSFFLLYLLFNSLREIFCSLTGSGNKPRYEEFLKDNGYIFYVSLLVSLIGGVIYLATMISIRRNRPSIYLLTTVKAFLLLYAIYRGYEGYQYACFSFDTLIVKHGRKLPLSFQDKLRSYMDDEYSILMIRVCLWVVQLLDGLVVYLAFLAFRNYIDELQEDLDDASVKKNLK